MVLGQGLLVTSFIATARFYDKFHGMAIARLLRFYEGAPECSNAPEVPQNQQA